MSAKRYRYTSKERDEETGFYYHGARYYAPWLGRWTAADPIGLRDGINVYRYSRNNPIVNSDPGGTQSKAFAEPGTSNYEVGTRTDPELIKHLRGLSSFQRAELLEGASGKFRERVSAALTKFNLGVAVRVGEVTIEGDPTIPVESLPEMTIVGDDPELVRRAEANGLSVEGQRFYEHTPGVIQAQDLRGFGRGLVNSPAATVEGVAGLVGVDVDLSALKLDVPANEASGALIGEGIGPGPVGVVGAGSKGLKLLGTATKLKTPVVTKAIFYRGTSAAAADEIVETQRFDAARIASDQAAVGAERQGVFVSSQLGTAESFADASFGGGRRLGPAVVRLEADIDKFLEFVKKSSVKLETPVPRPLAPGQTETLFSFTEADELRSFSSFYLE